jgi:hypothetical protein
MACCKLGRMSAYHRTHKKQDQALNILQVSKLTSYLWHVLPRQMSHSEILPLGEFMTDANPFWATLYLAHSGPFLYLPLFRLLPALISPVLFCIKDFDLSMRFIIEYTHLKECCSHLKGCLTIVGSNQIQNL